MLSVYLMSRPFTSYECKYNDRIIEETFQGRVIAKEEDSFYSGTERATLSNNGYIFVWDDELYEALKGEGFYNRIDVQDSLVKLDGEVILQIFKADSIITIDLSLPCDQEER